MEITGLLSPKTIVFYLARSKVTEDIADLKLIHGERLGNAQSIFCDLQHQRCPGPCRCALICVVLKYD